MTPHSRVVNVFDNNLIISEFKLQYILEIQLILNAIACANHMIVSQKKKECWLNSYVFFPCIYIFFSPVILIKHQLLFKQHFSQS